MSTPYRTLRQTAGERVGPPAMDYTAVLKFVETRFGLPNLTARDAAQADMSEFFDFAGAPNANPPNPALQPTGDLQR